MRKNFGLLFAALLASSISLCPACSADPVDPSSVSEDEVLAKPVSFQKHSGASNSLCNIKTHSALIKHKGNAVIGFDHPSVLQLKDGEILIDAEKTTVVKTPHSVITINPETIALISVENKVTKVRNLCESGHSTIRQVVAGKYVDLACSEESVLGWDQMGVNKALMRDTLGRRRVRGLPVPNGMYMQKAEVPLSILMQGENSECLHDLVGSSNPVDKALSDKLIKMAAVQQQVMGKHGQFMQYGSSHQPK